MWLSLITTLNSLVLARQTCRLRRYPRRVVLLVWVQGGQTWHGQTLGSLLHAEESSVCMLLTPSKESGWDLFWLESVLARLVIVRGL
jgi:hypothetical protein